MLPVSILCNQHNRLQAALEIPSVFISFHHLASSEATHLPSRDPQEHHEVPCERTCYFRETRETTKEIWSSDSSVFGESLYLPSELHIDLMFHIGKCTRKKPGYWIESIARRGDVG